MVMNKFLSVAVPVAALSLCWQMPSQAQQAPSNYVGPAIIFGGGNSAIGAQAKFGIADKISVRPVLGFLNGGTLIGASATYDFNFQVPSQARTQLEPFAGLGVAVGGGDTTVYAQVGTDFDVSDDIVLVGDIKIPLTGGSSLFAIGAGFKF
jgi:hypothetical protein